MRGMSVLARAGLCLGAFVAQAAEFALEGAQITVRFDPDSGGIVQITARNTQHEFIRKQPDNPLLWRLVFHDGSHQEVTLDNTMAGPPSYDANHARIDLRWDDLPLGTEEAIVDVRVQCRLNEAGDTAALELFVDNWSGQYGLWTIDFPWIPALPEAGTADVAFGRETWGHLYKNARDTISGEYPRATMPMQFTLIHEGSNGLYLAAHDRGAMYKQFTIEPGIGFRVTTRAAGMGVAGNDWDAPYPFILSVYRGDWMAGCKLYRAWAVAHAPWTQKGPLSARRDVPVHIRNVSAWLLANGTSEEVVPKVQQFAAAVGAPVGVHWYKWHEIPFDVYYPNYFPTKAGFAGGVKQLTEAGVTVMPYINARLWDTQNANFQEAKPYATKDEHGEVLIEEYGSGAKLAVMCPTQPFWQDTVGEIIRRLGDECGVNAVYLDQIASAPPRVCFDSTHGHPLGSGRWWVDGYRDMLRPIKKYCTSDGRHIGLTTENDADPYMDTMDSLLLWTPRSEHDIPMNTAVYSGYTLYFASNRAFYGEEAYCLCQARDFVWGTQLGWDGTQILEPEHAPELAFLSRLAKLRAKARDYLVYGELIEVLQPKNEIPTLTGTWNTPKGEAPVTLPAVHAALWRGRDKSAAILLANADTTAHAFTFELAPQQIGLEARSWRVTCVTPDTQTGLGHRIGSVLTETIEVPARDGVLLVVTPQ